MRVLLVTPVDVGSGETVTAAHLAESVVRRGGEVSFLASAFAAALIHEEFTSAIRMLGPDGDENRRRWNAALAEFRPDAVVFADYPLLFFSSGVAPLANEEWVRSLADVDAQLVTLDHTGFAQRPIGLFFGPPHLSFHYESLPGLPDRMHVLLPCPMHEPGPVEGRRGHPFRSWHVPREIAPETRAATRARHFDGADAFLVLHAAARWSWATAEGLGLPYYRYLPLLLGRLFEDSAKPVRLVSVNNGELLSTHAGGKVRITNLPSMPAPAFEQLLLSSDLMLTENRISLTIGKAVCGLVPTVALVNRHRYRELLRRADSETRRLLFEMESERPGAVYPYDIFPSGMREELERLGLYRDNSLTEAFRTLELYDVERTGRELVRLLADEDARAVLRARQQAYVDRLAGLDDGEAALRAIVAGVQ